MRFPLALTMKIASHIVKHKVRKTPKFAMVLQLEPLHTCNLTCTGCGRIREYSTNLKDMVPLEKCLAVAEECEAPMVSICGGEPLIYPKIEELIAGLLEQGRVIYVCTNGVFMRKKMRDYLAAIYTPETESTLKKLVAEKLISDKEADAIRNANEAAKKKVVIRPTKWMYWNVHVDGLEFTHDLIVEREGVFKECVEAIKMAKICGYQVATNTTVYKETDVQELEDMFKYLSSLEVDGHTISPGYEYDAAKKDMVSRLGKQPEDFFLTRKMTRQKFAKIQDWGKMFTIFGTPVYQEFLAGKRELTCTAWAIPTYNIKGWKAPCYLMTDGHYAGYQEMLREVNWDKYGVVDGIARDPRCENCMVHCGYDPSGALGTNYQRGDNWKNFAYNFGSKPRPFPASPELATRAFNGVTVGKGHLAEAKAVLNSPRAAMNGAQAAFSRKEETAHNHEAHVGSHCGTGDTTERDELLAKIKDAKRTE
ncbi:MAG: adenosyl-hopene transferase HpnH [Verrucomicrobia bacterium]|nr:adenosyl-hopene transferase HpnH [Verrucomicrobiota bacterium]